LAYIHAAEAALAAVKASLHEHTPARKPRASDIRIPDSKVRASAR
jgi:hypothetical protein